jgi:hypothetical protein
MAALAAKLGKDAGFGLRRVGLASDGDGQALMLKAAPFGWRQALDLLIRERGEQRNDPIR